jgi:hypothetical protein
MMPLSLRERIKASYHTFLPPLSDENIKDLLSFSLRAAEIDFTDEQLSMLSEHLDGHPFNVRFATKAIKSYGLPSFLADPHDLIEWKVRRGEEFLKHIEFIPIECNLIAAA